MGMEPWVVDRRGWAPGPWDGEPDRAEWRMHGYVCLALRGRLGHWCGYVAIPPGHPWYGVEYDALHDVEAHGGLTYSDRCQGHICHVPAEGEPDDVWWLGFDCGHSFDRSPGLEALLPERVPQNGETYRTLGDVQVITNALAAQARDAAEKGEL